jgi:hypothetical protein
MDLEANEPTVVGAPAPRSDVAVTMEVHPVPDSRPRPGGFGDGKAHESLIIDFEEQAAESAAFDGGEEKQTIRPAAQPLGKRVSSNVAQTKARPPAREESQTGGAMPPPNRRTPR